MSRVNLPKFLTPHVAEAAFDTISNLLEEEGNPYCLLKRKDLYIVVLVPCMVTSNCDYPRYPLEPAILFQKGIGDQKKWDHPYDEVARCKALQIWHDRSDGSHTHPHLLFQHDTPYFGGVKMEGIVVGCSGVQPWFDQMVARMMAAMCIAHARDNWENSHNKKDGVDFLT